MFNINEIKANYRGFTDARIVRIARNESKGLRKEVVAILVEEIRKRELGEDLVDWVRAETRQLSASDLKAWQNLLKACVCSNCGQGTDLRGFQYNTLIGALVMSIDTSRTMIVCTNCGTKDVKRSLYTTLLLGWWSFPSLFKMPFLLFEKMRNQLQKEQLSDEIITQFLNDRIGQITLSGETQEAMQALLDQFNAKEEEEFVQ